MDHTKSIGTTQPLNVEGPGNPHGVECPKGKSPTCQIVQVPKSFYLRLIEALRCESNCRVWEDDICSCGTERIRVEASKFLPS